MLSISNKKHNSHPDIFQKSLTALEASLEKQFQNYPQLVSSDHTWMQSEKFGLLLKEKYKKIVVCGIGGSSLGGKVVNSLVNNSNVFFLENVDGDHFDRFLQSTPIEGTGFIFISKSGNTIEVLALIEYLSAFLETKNIKLVDKSIVLTESEANTLGTWAVSNNIPLVKISSKIGGRFSVLSEVGMIIACYLDLDLKKFRQGATAAFMNRQFVAELMSQIVLSFKREEWITVLWAYDEKGRLLGNWFQQLWAESLAKKTTTNGQVAPRISTPVTYVGAVDQHSVLQQCMDGQPDKFFIFLRSKKAEAGSVVFKRNIFKETLGLVNKPMGLLLGTEAAATYQTMVRQNISAMEIQIESIDEFGLGELFMTFQMLVTGLGEYYDINAFDQPGVELGKSLAREMLGKS